MDVSFNNDVLTIAITFNWFLKGLACYLASMVISIPVIAVLFVKRLGLKEAIKNLKDESIAEIIGVTVLASLLWPLIIYLFIEATIRDRRIKKENMIRDLIE